MSEAEKERIFLFVCVENAGRSQMAQAFAEKYGLKSMSAGTVPSNKINPVAIDLMKEKGIDISNNVPKMLTNEMLERAGLVLTMGCSVAEVCPKPLLAQMKEKLINWDLDDPKGKSPDAVRSIRDEIERRVIQLTKEQD